MENLIQKKFGDSPIHIIIKGDNSYWFVAKYVCDALGLTQADKAIKSLNASEADRIKITVRSKNGILQQREVNIISESGLYKLMMRSNKPNAKKFQDWVAGEVLPEIRKTGGYSIKPIRTGYQIGEDLWHDYKRWAEVNGFSLTSSALSKRVQKMPQHFTTINHKRHISGYYASYLARCKEVKEEMNKAKLEIAGFERYKQLEFNY